MCNYKLITCIRVLKPWHNIPIIDNQEKLVSIPKNLNFISPHPYYKLGAPYRNKNNIWNLRKSVLDRLLKANDFLRSNYKNYFFLIYDSWRPLEVQEYMFNYACDNECKKNGITYSKENINSYPEIIKRVEKFWAFPSSNVTTPPPHSTGAAIDITLIDKSGNFIDMGCEVDQMDDKASPDYYQKGTNQKEKDCHIRRKILQKTMNKFGFAQHPNEWWHFSYGDQLWAWKNNKKNAIYGKI